MSTEHGTGRMIRRLTFPLIAAPRKLNFTTGMRTLTVQSLAFPKVCNPSACLLTGCLAGHLPPLPLRLTLLGTVMGFISEVSSGAMGASGLLGCEALGLNSSMPSVEPVEPLRMLKPLPGVRPSKGRCKDKGEGNCRCQGRQAGPQQSCDLSESTSNACGGELHWPCVVCHTECAASSANARHSITTSPPCGSP